MTGGTLLDDLKAVHQKYGSSEHPFALLETSAIESRFPKASQQQKKELIGYAFRAFNEVRKARLRLYPTVSETLRHVRRSGTLVVAYTEAAIYNVTHRLELLGISDDIDLIYAPPGRGEFGRVLGEPAPRPLPISKIRLLPSSHRKPNPAVLLDICHDLNVYPADTVYVGDSLVRDIAMAKRAGVRSVWARYGANVDNDLWQKLVRVTHWTDADVVNEKRLRDEYKDIQSDVNIDSFDALLTHFRFEATIRPQRTC